MDAKQGKGVFSWANGCSFEGNFENDKMHGSGVMEWSNGDRYEGEW